MVAKERKVGKVSADTALVTQPHSTYLIDIPEARIPFWVPQNCSVLMGIWTGGNEKQP